MLVKALTNRAAEVAALALKGYDDSSDAILILCAAIAIIGRESSKEDQDVLIDTVVNLRQFFTAKPPGE